jgi:transcription elongation GreA/GreB family factor
MFYALTVVYFYDKILRYTLVDSIESDPSDGRISIHSPLG